MAPANYMQGFCTTSLRPGALSRGMDQAGGTVRLAFHLGFGDGARWNRVGAAGVKAAAAGRIHGAGDVAVNENAMLVGVGVGHRH